MTNMQRVRLFRKKGQQSSYGGRVYIVNNRPGIGLSTSERH
jgi:hypothetical protein